MRSRSARRPVSSNRRAFSEESATRPQPPVQNRVIPAPFFALWILDDDVADEFAAQFDRDDETVRFLLLFISTIGFAFRSNGTIPAVTNQRRYDDNPQSVLRVTGSCLTQILAIQCLCFGKRPARAFEQTGIFDARLTSSARSERTPISSEENASVCLFERPKRPRFDSPNVEAKPSQKGFRADLDY